MTFDDFLRRRRLDVAAFRAAEPARAAEWAAWYATLHPDAFLLQVKQVINEVRRRYHLAEPPPVETPPGRSGGGRRARPGSAPAPPAEAATEPAAAPVATEAAPAGAPPGSLSSASEAADPPAVPLPLAASRPVRPRAVIRRPAPPVLEQGTEAAPDSPPTTTETGTWQPATTGTAVPDPPRVLASTPERPGPDVPEATPGRPEANSLANAAEPPAAEPPAAEPPAAEPPAAEPPAAEPPKSPRPRPIIRRPPAPPA